MHHIHARCYTNTTLHSHSKWNHLMQFCSRFQRIHFAQWHRRSKVSLQFVYICRLRICQLIHSFLLIFFSIEMKTNSNVQHSVETWKYFNSCHMYYNNRTTLSRCALQIIRILNVTCNFFFLWKQAMNFFLLLNSFEFFHKLK